MSLANNIKCLFNKHPHYKVLCPITHKVELIECLNCGKQYAIYYSSGVMLPWTKKLKKNHEKTKWLWENKSK